MTPRLPAVLSDIQQRQDERNSRLLKMGEQAKRLNFMSKFDSSTREAGLAQEAPAAFR